MTKRLTPLLDDPAAAPDVRELLLAGRDASVTDYDFNAGLERHMTHVQTGAPLPDWAKGLEGSSGTGTAVVTGTSLIGWLALPIATVAVVGAVMLLRDREPEPAPTVSAGAHGSSGEPTQVVQAAPTAVPAAAPSEAGLRADRAAREPHGSTRALETSRRAANGRGQSSAKSAAKRASTAAGTRPGSSATGTAATGAARAPSSGDLFDGSPIPTASQADNVARSARSASANAAQAERETAAEAVALDERRGEAKPEPAAIDDTRLEREMGMLAVAQRVLHTDAARTLSLARQGESEFAGSMFTQERKQLELLALVKLGRLDEAKRLARPYLARYPNGPFSDRVRRALATGRVER